jgi:hypothetical protein
VQVAAYTCVLAECLIATSAVRAVLAARQSRVDVQVAAYTCVLAECLIATSAVRDVL